MEELQLLQLEEKEINIWNFDSIKAELASRLSIYETATYTDETIKAAKNDKAELAKMKKTIEDKRKEYKAQCMAPYDAIEPQVKELVAMIEEQRLAIDGVVKDYTERQKEEKKAKIKEYYDKKSHVLGGLAEDMFERLLDSKWLNASAGNKYQEELQTKINNAVADIDAIKAMYSPFVDTVIEKYVATLSLDEAKAKHEELVTAANKAGLGSKEVDVQPAAPAPVQDNPVDAREGIVVKMYGSKNQIAQMMDFAKAIGVRIDMQ